MFECTATTPSQLSKVPKAIVHAPSDDYPSSNSDQVLGTIRITFIRFSTSPLTSRPAVHPHHLGLHSVCSKKHNSIRPRTPKDPYKGQCPAIADSRVVSRRRGSNSPHTGTQGNLHLASSSHAHLETAAGRRRDDNSERQTISISLPLYSLPPRLFTSSFRPSLVAAFSKNLTGPKRPDTLRPPSPSLIFLPSRKGGIAGS